MRNIIAVVFVVITLSACSLPANKAITAYRYYEFQNTPKMQNYGKFETKGMIFLEKLIQRAIINDPSPIPAE